MSGLACSGQLNLGNGNLTRDDRSVGKREVSRTAYKLKEDNLPE